MKHLLISAVLSALFLNCAAANLVFNGDFELGDSGFSLIRVLRPDTNKDLVFTPLVAADDGAKAKALLIRNPFAERFELHSQEFKLDDGKKYQLGLSAKASVNGTKISVIIFQVTTQGTWHVESKTFELTNRWQTFGFDFTAAKGDTPWHIQIRQPSGEPLAAADIWLDRLSVTPAGDTTPETGLDLAVVPAQTLYDLTPGLQIPCKVKVYNPTEKSITRTVSGSVTDDYFNREIARQSWEVSLAPKQSREIDWLVPANRFGAYRFTVAGQQEDRTSLGYAAVIGKYDAKKIDIGKDFCVSLNDGLEMVYLPEDPNPGYLSFGISPSDKMKLYSRMGCRLLRDHDAGYDFAAWSIMEPKQNEWDFSWFDRTLALARQNNITMLPVVGRSHFIEAARPNSALRWPTWVTPLCTRVTDDPPNTMPSVRGKILLPPIDLWAKYVRAVGERAGNEIKYYEIINEPNLFLSDDNYLKYLSSARTELKKVNPDNKIIGFCFSSDLGGNIDDFAQSCFQKGGLKLTEIVSFHPYGSRELGSTSPADRQISLLRQRIPDPAIGLWNTELYYIFDQSGSSSYGSMRCNPDQLARRFITDLGENVGQSVAVTGHQMWKNTLTPGMFHQKGNTQLIPSGNFVVYNTLARLLEGAKVIYKNKFPQNVVIYGFVKDGQPVAAVWNFGKQKGLSSSFDGFTVRDLFGNPVNQPSYALESGCYFLTAPDTTAAQFAQKLAAITVQSEQTFVIAPAIRLFMADKPFAMVNIKNNTNQSINGVAGILGETVKATQKVEVQTTPGAVSAPTIPVKVTGKSESANIIVFGDGKNERQSAVIYPATTLKVGETVKITAAKGDLTAQFCFVKAGEGLELQLTVNDATPSGDAGTRKFWEQDCVELFFDTAPTSFMSDHPQSYNDQVSRVFVNPYANAGSEITVWGKLTFTGKIVKSDRQYQVTLDLPKELTAGDFGFDLKVDDADGNAKAAVSASWQNCADNYKNRLGFGLVQIK